MTKRGLTATALTIALALAGCGKSGDQPGNGAAVSDQAGGGAEAARAKLSGYTAGYNKLLDTFGLPATVKAYTEENIATASPSDSISVTDGWLEQANTLLKTARAMPGGPADVDAGADKLIGALDAAMKRLDGLKVYYDSKAYKEDGLKRGKQEDPAMIAEFKAAVAAMDQFSALLDRERKTSQATDLAAMKAKGDMLGYHTKLALQQGEELVSLFNSDADIRNAALIAQGDAKVAVLEKTLAAQRVELGKAKASQTPEKRVDVNYELVADRLNSAIGDYRDLKQSGETDDYNDLVGHYNDAVEDANDIAG
ncbi:DUF3829 domain-containing protein [uncultured Sphingomonas sp.]|uniref:DUF3829 domain-containing protein n=1 Tax=uncultured Sphingomonas sp. TaxID=158754 RepID=UPI0035CB3C20